MEAGDRTVRFIQRPALKKVDTNQKKVVHWDTNVIDNEHKMKSRTGKGESSSRTPLASSNLTHVANTSVKVDVARAFGVPLGIQTKREIPVKARKSPGRKSSLPPVVVHQAQSPNHGVRRESRHRDQSSSPGREVKINRVPPPAPDPPMRRRQATSFQESQGPPPTPRPARLPTPDLPDFEGDMEFCGCPPCRKNVQDRPIEHKRQRHSQPEYHDGQFCSCVECRDGHRNGMSKIASQLEQAKAYMQGRRDRWE